MVFLCAWAVWEIFPKAGELPWKSRQSFIRKLRLYLNRPTILLTRSSRTGSVPDAVLTLIFIQKLLSRSKLMARVWIICKVWCKTFQMYCSKYVIVDGTISGEDQTLKWSKVFGFQFTKTRLSNISNNYRTKNVEESTIYVFECRRNIELSGLTSHIFPKRWRAMPVHAGMQCLVETLLTAQKTFKLWQIYCSFKGLPQDNCFAVE